MVKDFLKYKKTILLLLTLEVIAAFLIYINAQRETDTFINNKNNSVEVEFNAVYSKVREQSLMVYQEIINTPLVINSFKNAFTSNTSNKNIIRNKLYHDLLPNYQRLKNLVHIKQLHFHLPDNSSFLRMHKPNKFGDDLTGIRSTVEYVNQYKKPIDGFEEGRANNGFRFVYPLFDEDNHYLGSVEISFSVESFNRVLNNGIYAFNFIILKSIVDKKVWKEEAKLNYQTSLISPLFLVDISQFGKQDRAEVEQLKRYVTQEIQLDFEKKRLTNNYFSLPINWQKKTFLLTFLPIKNPISDKVVGYIILSTQNATLNEINTRFWIFQAFSVFVMLILFAFFYRNQKNHDLLVRSESKYRTIIENVKNHYFFYSHNINGVLTYVSHSVIDVLGYTESEFMAHYSIYLTDDPINDLAVQATNNVINGKEQKPYIISIYHKNGAVKYLECSEYRVNDITGVFVAVEGVIRDVTHSYLINQKLNEKNDELVKSKKALEEVFEASGEGIWDWNLKTNHVKHNNIWSDVTGLNSNQYLMKDFVKLIHEEDKFTVLKRIKDTLSGAAKNYQSEHRLIKHNGDIVWVKDKGRIVERDSQGNPVRMAGSFSEITKRKKADLLLQKSNTLLKKLSKNIPGVIYQYRLYPDGRSTFPYASLGFSTIFEIPLDKVMNGAQVVYEVLHPDDLNYILDAINKSAETMGLWSLEFRVKLPSKGIRWLEGQAKPEKLEDGSILWHGFIDDITDRKKIEIELEQQKSTLNHQAHHDALTELPNRVLFNDRLEQAIQSAKRSKTTVALLFIDLDHFKEINDSLGHDVGDEILKTVSHRLQEVIREEDTVARLGGDEFTVILEGLFEAQDASLIAGKLLNILSQPMNVHNNILYVSSSIGISVYPNDGVSAKNLLKYADSAMYKAKDEGRNNYQYYNSIMTELAFERVSMETSLRIALKEDQFVVYYQPQVDGTSDKIIGMEALVRWKHPTMGFVYPDKFIPLAESTGLIVELDRIVMKVAMTQISQWYKQGLTPGVLAMNLSVKQLQQKDFISALESLLKETGCKAQWIELEVTEGQIMTHPDEAVKLLTQISDLGIELAVDDFGTGYSSLAYLKKLPIDKLKIDQLFVRDLPADEEDAGITKAVIALAKSLNLHVIAEGVETVEQKDFLVKNGCSNIQGYLYSKPIPCQEFENILKDGFTYKS